MYAITGITGNVGGAVAHTLLAAGEPVRAVLRDAARSHSWAEHGCEIATAKPSLRMRMLDGFDEGWITFEGKEADIVKGNVELETVLRAFAQQASLTRE